MQRHLNCPCTAGPVMQIRPSSVVWLCVDMRMVAFASPPPLCVFSEVAIALVWLVLGVLFLPEPWQGCGLGGCMPNN